MKIKGKVWEEYFKIMLKNKTVLLLGLLINLLLFSYAYSEEIDIKSYNEEAEIELGKNKKFILSIWGGYTTVTMSDFNNNIEYLNYKFKTLTHVTSTETNCDKPDNGYMIGIDLSYKIHPRIKIGPRVSYIMISAKNVQSSFDEDIWLGNYYYVKYKETDKYNLTLLPILLGGEYLEKYNQFFSYNVKLYLGYGLATMKWVSEEEREATDGNNYTDSFESTWEGSDFVGEASFGIDYKLNSILSFGVDIGYRLAKIGKIELSESSLGLQSKGFEYEDQFGKLIALDFTGMTVSGSLNISF